MLSDEWAGILGSSVKHTHRSLLIAQNFPIFSFAKLPYTSENSDHINYLTPLDVDFPLPPRFSYPSSLSISQYDRPTDRLTDDTHTYTHSGR